jgi:hypothetical protein
MKKVSIMLFLLMLGVAFNGFSQASAPSDFFAGKWKGVLPNGSGSDTNAPPAPQIDIVREEGKLTVHLGGNTINVRVQEESATKLAIVYDMAINPGFATQQITSRDEHLTLTKVDDSTIETSIMGMALSFKRVK